MSSLEGSVGHTPVHIPPSLSASYRKQEVKTTLVLDQSFPGENRHLTSGHEVGKEMSELIVLMWLVWPCTGRLSPKV